MMNELSALVSFLTKAKSAPCLQGWGLIRTSKIEKYSTWTHQWITIENGVIVWYSDDLRSVLNGVASIANVRIEIAGVLDQTETTVLNVTVSLPNQPSVLLELGLKVEEIPLWQNVLNMHKEVSDEATKLKYVEEIQSESVSVEDGKAVATMQVTLKGKPHSIQVSPEDNVSVIADKFIDDNKLKPEIKSRIETELLKTQLDACLVFEGKLRKSLLLARGRANERITLEERCFAAEQTTANLIENIGNIQILTLQVKDKLESVKNELVEKSKAADDLTILLEKEHAETLHVKDVNKSLLERIDKIMMEEKQARKRVEDLESQSSGYYKKELALNMHGQSIEAELSLLKQQYSLLQSEGKSMQEKLNIADLKYKDAMQKYQMAVMTGKRAAERIRSGAGNKPSHAAGDSEQDDTDNDDYKQLKAKFEEKLKVLRTQVAAHDEFKLQYQKKYDDCAAALSHTTTSFRKSEDEVNKLKMENKELKLKLDVSSPTKLSQSLAEENKTLRQQMVTHKGDMKKVKKQMDEIEESAMHAIRQIVLDIGKRFEESAGTEDGYHEMQQFLQSVLTSIAKPENEENNYEDFDASGKELFHSGAQSPQYEAPVVDEEDEVEAQEELVHLQMNKESGFKYLPDFSKREVLYDLITPIVEDRLLRSVYFKYVSDISGGMNITRMGRFAKEFGIVACNLPAGSIITSANKAPFLTSGEVDMIYLNACKLEDGVVESATISAWEEHMGLLSSTSSLRGGVDKNKQSPFNVRHSGDRIGGPSGNESRSINGKGHISVHQLTIGQFVTCMRAIATRLYASLIEQQTGTILECLPPRQKEVATAAALEVLLKKKILPVAESLGLLPWPLIFLDQTLTSVNNSVNVNNILVSRLDMMVQLFHRYATDTTLTLPVTLTSHQLLVDDMVDAIRSPQQKLNLSRKGNDGLNSPPLHHHNPHHGVKTITIQALTYKSLSQMAHDFGLIPALLKEGEFFCQFEEIALWCKTDLHLMISALSNELLSRCVLFQEEMEWRQTHLKIREQIKKTDSTKSLSVSHGPSQFPNQQIQQVLGMASFLIMLSSIALQTFADLHPEVRIERLFEWIQQGGDGTIHASKKSPNRRNVK